MAEGLYLVQRTGAVDANDIDGVRNVVMNNDDGDTDADIITAAIAALNTAAGVSKFPAGYFDTVNEISDLVTAGDLRTDQDFIAFGGPVYENRT